jgi:hypothetical protein
VWQGRDVGSFASPTGKSLRFIGIGFGLSQALAAKIKFFRLSEIHD